MREAPRSGRGPFLASAAGTVSSPFKGYKQIPHTVGRYAPGYRPPNSPAKAERDAITCMTPPRDVSLAFRVQISRHSTFFLLGASNPTSWSLSDTVESRGSGHRGRRTHTCGPVQGTFVVAMAAPVFASKRRCGNCGNCGNFIRHCCIQGFRSFRSFRSAV